MSHSTRIGMVLVASILLATDVAAQTYGGEPAVVKQRRKSHLGLGIGLSGTASQVGDVFGSGTDASIAVNQHLYKGFGVRLLVGGIYLGSPEEEAKLETYLTGLDFFGSSFRNFSMTYEYITIGPSFFFELGESHSLAAAVAWGPYYVKMDLASTEAHRFKVSNRRYGFNAGVMYAYWVGDSWGLNARFELNRIDTKSKEDDLYHVFVRGDSDPLFISFLVGFQVGYR